MHGNSNCQILCMNYFYLSKVLICLVLEFKKETLQWITQNNKCFALAQTQYKVTDQFHGNVCLLVLGLWK